MATVSQEWGRPVRGGSIDLTTVESSLLHEAQSPEGLLHIAAHK